MTERVANSTEVLIQQTDFQKQDSFRKLEECGIFRVKQILKDVNHVFRLRFKIKAIFHSRIEAWKMLRNLKCDKAFSHLILQPFTKSEVYIVYQNVLVKSV